MSENFRSLVVVLALASAVFAFARAPACAQAMSRDDFDRRRKLWLGITCVVFLAHNFWLYLLATGALLYFAVQREQNNLALFSFVLFAVPGISEDIPGFGLINHFAEIGYLRLLSLAVLLPAYLSLRRQPETEPFGRLLADKFLIGHLFLNAALIFVASTFTHSLRAGVVYGFLDVFLPYYVASRSLKTLAAFREVLMGFVLAALVLSAIAGFESVKHWLLYASLEQALGVQSEWTAYLVRGGDDGALRALASAGHAIPLGYVIAVAITLYLYLKKAAGSALAWYAGLVLLFVGLIAPLSRGPWVGALAMVLVLILLGRSPAKGVAKLALAGVLASPLLVSTSAGEKILALLPFVGEMDHTVTYRQQLVQVSLGLIMDNPFFGSYDYIYSPEMQAMKQGQGIVDVVNTYVAIGLGSGMVGLFLFVGLFVAAAGRVLHAMHLVGDRADERHRLGRTLLAVLVGILVMIATVSSITVIPVVYWTMAGISVGYASMLARERQATGLVGDAQSAAAENSPQPPVADRPEGRRLRGLAGREALR